MVFSECVAQLCDAAVEKSVLVWLHELNYSGKISLESLYTVKYLFIYGLNLVTPV